MMNLWGKVMEENMRFCLRGCLDCWDDNKDHSRKDLKSSFKEANPSAWR
jgi:hypothetical protein